MIVCKRLLLLCLLVLLRFTVWAQCTGTISTFPYQENFEVQGSWLPGGTSSSWVWGSPSKPIITKAGSGQKCWITGGLTTSFYPIGENSFLRSPCFDFTTLTNPQISFKVFWETERRWDGANLQYSTDGGNSWQTLGANNDNNNCTASNWFNYAGVSSLSADGWSGTIKPTVGSCQGGGGSNGWLTARRSLTALAGKNNVVFRFRFTAGTTCNDYDGFAIDDIVISETPVAQAGFFYNCNAGNTLTFNNTSPLCATSYNWNFGDAASGSNNTSTLENPAHTFSAAGTFLVTLTVTYPGSIIRTATQNINVINATATQVKSVSCKDSANGIAGVTVTGGTGSYTYNWNTTPAQTTATATGLKAGSYAVTVSATNSCTVTSGVTITEPAALSLSLQATNALCGRNDGVVQSFTGGGTTPYQYQWSNGSTTSFIYNLTPGTYSLTLKDANNCTTTSSAIVKDSVNVIRLSLGNDTSFCPGTTLTLKPGTFDQYRWQDNSTNPTYTITKTGKYYVTVTDDDGCTASDTLQVVVDCSDVYFPTGFTPNNDNRNDLFGAVGNLAALKNYRFEVYNRWGQAVFTTTDAFRKWDGTANGKPVDSGTYVWFAYYNINNNPQRTQKGTVTLIR